MVMPNPTPPINELQLLRDELAARIKLIGQLFDNLESQITEVHKHSKLVNARVDNLHQIITILMPKDTTP